MVKLGGVVDTDGVVELSVGSNVITIEVTAEDGQTTRTYAITVIREAPSSGGGGDGGGDGGGGPPPPSSDASLSGLVLSGVDFGTFVSGTTSYTAQVANSIAQTTVTLTVNHPGASYDVKLGGVTDVDSMVELGEGRNVITVEVTAEDGETVLIYTVTVDRESLLERYDPNDDGVIGRSEVIDAIKDYFDGIITRQQAVEIIRLYLSPSQ